MFGVRCSITLAFTLLPAIHAQAQDWPTYRHDNRRSGVTSATLTLPLTEKWTHNGGTPAQAWTGPAKWDAYSGNDGLQSMRNFDPCYYTTVSGKNIYYGSSADDAVHCLDATTGKEKWVAFAAAAVRFPPTIAGGKAWFGSDDGFIYSADAATGDILFKKRAAPSDRLIPSNGKLISPWPVRTGVTIDQGRAWFAASLVPWKKSYLHCLDAKTGETAHLTEHTNLTLQGAILAGGEKIYIPQGRAAPLAFHQKDGKSAGTVAQAGGVYCLLTEDHQLISGPQNQREKNEQMRLNDPKTGKRLATFNQTNRVVVDRQNAYLHTTGNLKQILFKKQNTLNHTITTLTNENKNTSQKINAIIKEIETLKTAKEKAPKQKEIEALKATIDKNNNLISQAKTNLKSTTGWSIPHPAPLELIIAGPHLITGHLNQVHILDLKTGKLLQTLPVKGNAHGLTVAHGQLIISTDQGLIHTFGQ